MHCSYVHVWLQWKHSQGLFDRWCSTIIVEPTPAIVRAQPLLMVSTCRCVLSSKGVEKRTCLCVVSIDVIWYALVPGLGIPLFSPCTCSPWELHSRALLADTKCTRLWAGRRLHLVIGPCRFPGSVGYPRWLSSPACGCVYWPFRLVRYVAPLALASCSLFS